MPSLVDIIPAVKQVKVGKEMVDVTGISAEGIAVLLRRFPSVQRIMTGFAHQVKPEEMARLIPEAIPAVIAAGCGSPEDKKAEAIAAKLPLSTQMDLLEAIMEVTMPEGFAPFVERLEAIGLVVAAQSRKVRATTSPQASKSSKPQDTQTPESTPREKSPSGSTTSESASAAST